MNKTSGDERPRADRPGPERAGRPDDADAFFPDPTGQVRQPPIPDTESFAEEFIDSATSANMAAAEAEDEVVLEEEGGPFIVLGDDAKLPPEPGEAEDGAASVEREDEEKRGASWAARGV